MLQSPSTMILEPKTVKSVTVSTLENPVVSKEIKPVNPEGNQHWIFTGRTDAEVAILWPPDVKSELTGKDPDAGKDWGQEKEATQDELVGWHQRTLTQWAWVWVNSRTEWNREFWRATVHGVAELDTVEKVNKVILMSSRVREPLK